MASDGLLNFKEWIRSNPTIPFSDRGDKYQEYISGQVLNQTSNSEVARNELRNTLEVYLKRLTVFFEDDPEVRLLRSIDFDNPIELASAIPIFAKKLKDVAEFAKRQRDELKNKKEEFSTKGSSVGVKNKIKTDIVDKFSKTDGYINPNIVDTDVVNNLVDRKTLDKNMEVCIIEKYNIC